ncbi:hypothetical protein Y1Q_0000176 [Alligator mississippiensis]|uniref:Uncharacterized protein n=1 Tax=Alligator mississippiensis TaxID=8496 RepID=A0A151MZT0_ALLMI|nr:hypothetical protein Y1Q_0000176 [Alligator mississippiensis]
MQLQTGASNGSTFQPRQCRQPTPVQYAGTTLTPWSTTGIGRLQAGFPRQEKALTSEPTLQVQPAPPAHKHQSFKHHAMQSCQPGPWGKTTLQELEALL